MLHHIIESNNNGIRCLEAGRHDLAKEFFKLALEQITKILHLFRDHQSSQGFAPIKPPSIVHIPISESSVGEIMSFKSSYIYRYALTLEIDREGLPGVDQNIVVYQYSLPLAIVIMFNLGFVHHFHTTQEPQSQNVLIKALRLYEMAWSLVQRSQYGSFSDHYPYVLGILNNMGAIHHELEQYDQARDCFVALKSLLLSGASVDEADASHGIMMNVMFLEKPYIAPAA